MARRVLDYNPLTGETVWFDYDHAQDQMILTTEQPVDEILRQTTAMQNDAGKTARGIKEDMWHYARIPNTVIMEMKQKHGVDFFDKNDWPAVFRLINTEYSRFKTTSKTHAPRN